jgi:guanosine-3',5'-bis(diphosphate) 3'-pyrophosphohydrolase
MLMAMARDLRVVLIKLADRHHNLQTMAAVRADKRRRIARETLEIYAPIANRLGLNKLFRELQDLSFQLIYPMRARVLGRALKAARGNRRELLSRILEGIKGKLRTRAYRGAGFRSREEPVFDLSQDARQAAVVFAGARRLRLSRRGQGCAHRLSRPRCAARALQTGAGEVQGLHRHPQAERLPVAAHDLDRSAWHAVRVADSHRSDGQRGAGRHRLALAVQGQRGPRRVDLQQKTTKWFHSLLDLQSATGDSSEFLEHVKVDLFPHEIYVFTPKGKIIALPRGATAVDLAYAVHTDIGNHCIARRSISSLMPLVDRADQRRSRRDRHRRRCASEPGLAELGQDRSGAQQDPPLPESRAP